MFETDVPAVPDSLKRHRRLAQKKLDTVIGQLVRVSVACGILMWSVFNIWLNVLSFGADEQTDQAWTITAGMVFLTCGVPFLIGLKMLCKTPKHPTTSNVM